MASLFPAFEEHPAKCSHCGVNATTNDFPSAAVFHGLNEDPVGCSAICDGMAVQVVMHNGGWGVRPIWRYDPPEQARD